MTGFGPILAQSSSLAVAAATSEAAPASAGRGWEWLHLCLCPLLWSTVCAVVALWLVLPRGTQRGRTFGNVLAGLSFLLLAVWLPRFGQTTDALAREATFWCFALLAAGGGLATISMRSPVYSALSFAVSLLGVAGLFFLQGAQFLAVATVVVYAGAIVVTFLFVVMLAQPTGQAYYDRMSWGTLPLVAASLVAAVTVSGLAVLIHQVEQPLREVRQVLAEANTFPEVTVEASDVLVVRFIAAGAIEEKARLQIQLADRLGGPTEEDIFLAKAALAQRFGVTPDRLSIQTSVASPGHDIAAEPHVAGLGRRLFSSHLASVEAAGTLLLAALFGAVAVVVHGRKSRSSSTASSQAGQGAGHA